MQIVHSAFSLALARGGNKACETLRYTQGRVCEEGWYPIEDEGVSPNASEPDSASLNTNPPVANLPDMLKPATCKEEMDKSTCRTGRSGWGERAPKERLDNLGDPLRRANRKEGKATIGNHNNSSCGKGKSEWLIVTMKRGNALGVKEPYCKHAINEISRADWNKVPTTDKTQNIKLRALPECEDKVSIVFWRRLQESRQLEICILGSMRAAGLTTCGYSIVSSVAKKNLTNQYEIQ